MIDAGHGGGDPGAINYDRNLKEKDINLAVASFMRSICFNGDYLFECKMTRRRDESIPLRTRCKRAAFFNVDGFMSIHTNARPLKGRQGLEIEIFHYPGSVRGRAFAKTALDHLLRAVGEEIITISRGIKEKAFYVLKHTTMPSILVELGFISDKEEALFLKQSRHQEIMAKALLESAEHFFEGGESEWPVTENQ